MYLEDGMGDVLINRGNGDGQPRGETIAEMGIDDVGRAKTIDR